MEQRSSSKKFIVGIGGFSSEVGKTTLMCDLLRAFPGWEAIKLTRGHYRSCGKDPHACCVSHLLSDQPLILSGRDKTYALGKDTGRYWEAGAANVHWVIVTDNQVEQGIKEALDRVQAPGVFIEGNSFLKFINPDYAIMAARPEGGRIKGTARQALSKSGPIYLFNDGHVLSATERFTSWLEQSPDCQLLSHLPIFTHSNLSSLVKLMTSALMGEFSVSS